MTTMTPTQAADILEAHNASGHAGTTPFPALGSPGALGLAMAAAAEFLRAQAVAALKLRIAEAAIVAHGTKFAVLHDQRPESPALEAIWEAVDALLSAEQLDQQGEDQ